MGVTSGSSGMGATTAKLLRPGGRTGGSSAESAGLGSRYNNPAKSEVMLFGASQRSRPRMALRPSSAPSSAMRCAACFGASRSFASVSPSSDFVDTQQCPMIPCGPSAPSSSRSAGKISRFRTLTISPTRTSSHRLGSKAPDSASNTCVACRFVIASARRRCQSSYSFVIASTPVTNSNGPSSTGTPPVTEICGTACRQPTQRK
mmetsp:Transcript_21797/g.55301  ORF Transcript_21797/g.55301 Transcript_21797/m.55301 type:complete len:204 (-) Transcript_21797:259-870(-)